MRQKKTTIVLETNIYAALEDLPSDIYKDVFQAVLKYGYTGEVSELSNEAMAYFKMIKVTIDENNEKYAETCKNRSEAKKKKDAEKAEALKSTNATIVTNVANITTFAKCTDRIGKDRIGKDRIGKDDRLIDIYSDNVNKNVKVNSSAGQTAEELEQWINQSINQIQDAWNSLGIYKIYNINPKQYQAINRLLEVYSPEDICEGLKKINDSPYLKGETSNKFRISFEQALSPEHFDEIRGGKYDGSAARTRAEMQEKDAEEYGGDEVGEFLQLYNV
jgi:hypothetical protein